MVVILLSYWGGLFSGAMLVSGRVIWKLGRKFSHLDTELPIIPSSHTLSFPKSKGLFSRVRDLPEPRSATYLADCGIMGSYGISVFIKRKFVNLAYLGRTYATYIYVYYMYIWVYTEYIVCIVPVDGSSMYLERPAFWVTQHQKIMGAHDFFWDMTGVLSSLEMQGSQTCS